jgi:hypothetical protein
MHVPGSQLAQALFEEAPFRFLLHEGECLLVRGAGLG